MKAILLDGSQRYDPTGARVRAALIAQLESRGWDTAHVAVREYRIGNCAGDFFCWIRSPGVCNVNDDNRVIAEAIARCGLLVYLTPVTFGGYGSALKRMVDHQIQNISPFFASVGGETHHTRRYRTYPDMLAVGWMDAPDGGAEAVFRHLARRNAINFHAARHASGVVTAGQTDAEILAAVQWWLHDLGSGEPAPAVHLPAPGTAAGRTSPVERALLLVGSPRTRASNSWSLGGYLNEQLETHAVHTDTIFVHTALGSPSRRRVLLDAVDEADLVTLAFPLYVDSLPAPVIEALERITAFRRGRPPGPQRFAAIANCGFPEAHHNATALAICERFASQAGFGWAGALALGGGELIGGMPLHSLGGKAVRIRQALDLAAAELAQGRPIPAEARDLMAKPVVPAWLYRVMGGHGWRQRAKAYNAVKMLRRQPYAPVG